LSAFSCAVSFAFSRSSASSSANWIYRLIPNLRAVLIGAGKASQADGAALRSDPCTPVCRGPLRVAESERRFRDSERDKGVVFIVLRRHGDSPHHVSATSRHLFNADP
jgi:hypothetical protein